MTIEEKLEMVKSILGISEDDMSEDKHITTYLTIAKNEIISWRYSYACTEEPVTEVPAEYEMVQIHAVVAGYSIRGAENQKTHNENGINRTFSFSDMIDYIRAHTVPICKVV